MRMQAVRGTSKGMSLNKALQYCRMSKHAKILYQKTKRRPDECRCHLQGKRDILQAARARNRTYGSAGCKRLRAFLQTVKKYSVYVEK